eukprot:scaffold49706_cov58-Phaeocystis_antarctica.AAC.1
MTHASWASLTTSSAVPGAPKWMSGHISIICTLRDAKREGKNDRACGAAVGVRSLQIRRVTRPWASR